MNLENLEKVFHVLIDTMSKVFMAQIKYFKNVVLVKNVHLKTGAS